MLLLPLAFPCASESSEGTRSATARIGFTVVVPPVFKVLQTTPVAGGHEYRVWANVKSIVLNGQEHRFARVGEATLFVPTAKDAFIVHGL
ncbi:hypothetical protein C7T35_28030 [Variovorax sp. WS11]|uniref:hypothetical protein n=1 Tax=Variovorax sp. WS11 TaxID=1105204 RepID=UPI000D0D4836|nr:hypothetical protein [Variovorax sp. WS11]NDZ17116.1 hypothetical protein [Variovorax sp. WS11]PSL81272.1 hypothetical protein C7T35_28030 [Variovorax sp. WS11]